MDNPKITYQVLNKIDDVFYEQNETYAGTYNGRDPLSVTIRIWNNFGGTEDVEDLTNFNLTLRFLTVTPLSNMAVVTRKSSSPFLNLSIISSFSALLDVT